MQAVLFILFFGLVVVGLALIAWAIKRKRGIGFRYVGGIIASIAFIFLVLIPGGYYQVEAGEAALIKEFGQAKSVETAGLKWRFWDS